LTCPHSMPWGSFAQPSIARYGLGLEACCAKDWPSVTNIMTLTATATIIGFVPLIVSSAKWRNCTAPRGGCRLSRRQSLPRIGGVAAHQGNIATRPLKAQRGWSFRTDTGLAFWKLRGDLKKEGAATRAAPVRRGPNY